MKKTLYSLMLSDEVIREIDLLAHRLGTNRSSLVNSILAEHVKLRTPEQRVGDILRTVEELMSSSRELIPLPGMQSGGSMALRSCLEYKYRPTVRYEVGLYPSLRDGSFGELSIVFRTTSSGLLEILGEFFRILCSVERKFLAEPHSYTASPGRFTRSLVLPENTDEPDTVASAISDYIRVLDRLMKGFVAGNINEAELAAVWLDALANGKISV